MKCKKGKCKCKGGKKKCGKKCFDVATDPANCGSCGHACASGQTCTNGQCTGGDGNGGGDNGGGDGGGPNGGGDGGSGSGCTTAADCPNPTTTCQIATCVSGTCGFANGGGGTPCDDGNPCTIASVCLNGACQGGVPITCLPADVCHMAGVCDPATGGCSNPPAPNGTPCGLGTCQGGVCVDPCTPNPCNTPPPPGPCVANSQLAYLPPGICTPAGPGFTCFYTPTFLPC